MKEKGFCLPKSALAMPIFRLIATTSLTACMLTLPATGVVANARSLKPSTVACTSSVCEVDAAANDTRVFIVTICANNNVFFHADAKFAKAPSCKSQYRVTVTNLAAPGAPILDKQFDEDLLASTSLPAVAKHRVFLVTITTRDPAMCPLTSADVIPKCGDGTRAVEIGTRDLEIRGIIYTTPTLKVGWYVF
jgi:hypothetical protein